MKSIAILSLLLATTVNAATIAVIDTGTDLTHKDLRSSAWINPSMKIVGPYAEAVNGWNFVENNAQIFDPALLETFDADVLTYKKISAKSLLFSATEEEKQWAKEKALGPCFIDEVTRFGSYIHGTHVAGIARKGTSHLLMGVKYLATPIKKTVQAVTEAEATGTKFKGNLTTEKPAELMLLTLGRLATLSAARMKEITTFVNDNGAEVVNGSYGMGFPLAAGYVKGIFKTIYERDPASDELALFTMVFLDLSTKAGEDYIKAAPNTLFVFAAGNDGLDNDIFGTTPANIKMENTITVAATYEDYFFAPFSNYGVKLVDVAAPGMAIESTIPGNDYLAVSGTSQATPAVARIAGLIKDANPALTPAQMKKILMETVDKKDFLKTRVASGGAVNQKRAVLAATLSKKLSLDEAIKKAQSQVGATKSKSRIKKIPTNVVPIPLPSLFE